jgi:hypothetical protein
MTQPPDPLDVIRSSIGTLERTVNGDAGMGVRPLRAVTDDLRAALSAIERERANEAAERRGQNRALTWIFGTSLSTAVAVVVALIKLFGGS